MRLVGSDLPGSPREQGAPGYGLCACGCGQKTPIAPRNCGKRGWVKGEPVPCCKGHKRTSALVRFLAMVPDRPDDGCWVWTGYTRNGYGLFRASGRQVGVHRWAYEHFVGPVPKGLFLDHLCRNRQCVNPAHLEPVTCAENNRRGARTKLSLNDAQAIRESTASAKQVASEFGIGVFHVRKIRRGIAWREGAA